MVAIWDISSDEPHKPTREDVVIAILKDNADEAPQRGWVKLDDDEVWWYSNLGLGGFHVEKVNPSEWTERPDPEDWNDRGERPSARALANVMRVVLLEWHADEAQGGPFKARTWSALHDEIDANMITVTAGDRLGWLARMSDAADVAVIAEAQTLVENETLAPGQMLPLSDDAAALSLGEALTTCCAATVTFHDTTLCCKGCWKEIP